MSTDRKDDGGPAFPHANPSFDSNWDDRRQIEGMSLRDHFAAKAMQGFAADPTNHQLFDDMDDVARSAYAMADAMLKARKA